MTCTDLMEDVEIIDRIDYYSKIQKENNLKSVWSIFEVTDFSEIPFPDAHSVVYVDHWGIDTIYKTIPNNSTWLDLWKIADECIEDSEDNHHIFVERFDCNDSIIELKTGS